MEFDLGIFKLIDVFGNNVEVPLFEQPMWSAAVLLPALGIRYTLRKRFCRNNSGLFELRSGRLVWEQLGTS